jgi:hypothetical protein
MKMTRKRWQISTLLIASVTLPACALWSGSRDQHYVCSYDVVWDAALDSVKGRSLQIQDKAKGLIETGWLEMEGRERPYGMFGREGFGNKERSRMTVTVKNLNDVTAASVLETRQRWHEKGGVTQQATKWWPIEPSEEAMAEVVGRLNSKLNENGCTATS